MCSCVDLSTCTVGFHHGFVISGDWACQWQPEKELSGRGLKYVIRVFTPALISLTVIRNTCCDDRVIFPRFLRTFWRRHTLNQSACVFVHIWSELMPLFVPWLCKVAEKIRPTIDKYNKAFPALLEIPSKDHPYGALISFSQPIVWGSITLSQTLPKILSSNVCKNSSEINR